MVNMFVPGALDEIVKERAEKMRLEQRESDEDVYVPEWKALLSLLDADVLAEFESRHDGTLESIDLIAEATGENIRLNNTGGD